MKTLPSSGEHFIEDVRDRGSVTWRHERLLAEIGHADVRSGRGTVGCEGGHCLLLAQVLHGELIGDLAGEKTESGVELVGRKSAEHVGGNALGQADVDTRMSAAEPCQQPRHVDVTGGEQCANPDVPAQDATQLVDLLACAVQFGQDAPGPTGDDLSGLGWQDTAARPLEQRCSELVLQPLDLVGEGRLGEVQFLSSPCEVAVPSDGLDAYQLPQFHHERS